MKKFKNLPFIFFLLFAILLLSNIQSIGETEADFSYNSTVQSHDFYANLIFNETTLFVQLDSEYLEFRTIVNYWGEDIEGPYQGLLISLVFDFNDTEIKSWLIPSSDVENHHFITDSRITGIVKIVFTALNVEELGYSLSIDNHYTLWTYELITKPDLDVYFGIERSEFEYQEVEKMVVSIVDNFINSDNFSITIYYENDDFVAHLDSNLDYEEDKSFTLWTYDYLVPDVWYNLSLKFEDYNSTSWISTKLYYDHIAENYITRLFLNYGDNNLEEIPLDLVHSDYYYMWYIDYYNYYNSDASFFWVIIIYFARLFLYGAIIFAFIAICFRVVVRRRRKKTVMDSIHIPSAKFQYLNESVSYQPQETVAINFNDAIEDYSLKTSEKSKVKCSICLQIIGDHKNLIRCPSCDIAYHKNHLYQWIVGNGTCPACKSRLRITQK